jgi:hypothetical protein
MGYDLEFYNFAIRLPSSTPLQSNFAKMPVNKGNIPKPKHPCCEMKATIIRHGMRAQSNKNNAKWMQSNQSTPTLTSTPASNSPLRQLLGHVQINHLWTTKHLRRCLFYNFLCLIPRPTRPQIHMTKNSTPKITQFIGPILDQEINRFQIPMNNRRPLRM